MMALDFSQAQWLRYVMDEDTAELIAQLCTRVGMIMEDTSIIALKLGGSQVPDRTQGLRHLTKASEEISSLIAAATTLSE